MELSNDAFDREFFAGSLKAPANLLSSFNSYCFHASNRNAPSSGLKYFVRLPAIGVFYALFFSHFRPMNLEVDRLYQFNAGSDAF